LCLLNPSSATGAAASGDWVCVCTVCAVRS
jgi:hypothetical protein